MLERIERRLDELEDGPQAKRRRRADVTETRNSIDDIWGPRTPHASGSWPVRVDERTRRRGRALGALGLRLCSTGCGMDVGVAGGRIVGVRGRADDRVNRGRLGPKGLHGWEANTSDERLTHAADPPRRPARARHAGTRRWTHRPPLKDDDREIRPRLAWRSTTRAAVPRGVLHPRDDRGGGRSARRTSTATPGSAPRRPRGPASSPSGPTARPARTQTST